MAETGTSDERLSNAGWNGDFGMNGGYRALALITLICGGCAHKSGDRSDDATAEALANLSRGAFRTVVTKRGIDYIEYRHPIASLGEGEWMYAQINNGPERALYRQSVYQLIDTAAGVIQKEFEFRDADAFADLRRADGTLGSFTRADLEPAYKPGCDMRWQLDSAEVGDTWEGRIDPKTCRVFSPPRGTDVALGATVYISKQSYRKRDSGYDLAGNVLWGGSPEHFIDLVRIER